VSRYPKIDLDGAVVAVTGAARGIGLATAKAFVAEGARVAMGDLDEELVKEAAAELGFAASGHRLDVTDPESFAEFLAAAEEVHGGPIDVLDNNAGVMPNGAFLDQTERADRLTMDVNVHGVINGMRAALPGMIERRRGHVVNVASLAGKLPIKGLAVYNASNFAVVGLTAATRLEYDGTGVSISGGAPVGAHARRGDRGAPGRAPRLPRPDREPEVAQPVWFSRSARARASSVDLRPRGPAPGRSPPGPDVRTPRARVARERSRRGRVELQPRPPCGKPRTPPRARRSS